MSTSDPFTFFCFLITLQVSCEAAPFLLEITRTNPRTGEIVFTKLSMEDAVVRRIYPDPSRPPQPMKTDASTQTDSSDISTSSSSTSELEFDNPLDARIYDAAESYYDYDCAVPVMPDISDNEEPTNNTVRQTEPPPAYRILDSVVGGVNGVVMDMAAAGKTILNLFSWHNSARQTLFQTTNHGT